METETSTGIADAGRTSGARRKSMIDTAKVRTRSELERAMRTGSEMEDAEKLLDYNSADHLLPYLGQFAGASGFYAYSGDVVAAGGEARPLPWRLMGLNSNLWYKSNSYTQDMADPADHFRQDRGTLIPQMLDLKN